jgi:nucleotidyltransferase/DNA polymerase involved in DNA repair
VPLSGRGPDRVVEFLAPISIQKIYGVGPKTAERLREMGLESIADVQAMPREDLVETLGGFGEYVYDVAFGRDAGEVVEPSGPPESISTETTFARDLERYEQIWPELEELARALHAQLLQEHYSYRTVSLKVKYSNFEVHTRSRSLKVYTADLEPFLVVSQVLLKEVLTAGRPVRLVGVRLSNLTDHAAPQATLARWSPVAATRGP